MELFIFKFTKQTLKSKMLRKFSIIYHRLFKSEFVFLAYGKCDRLTFENDGKTEDASPGLKCLNGFLKAPKGLFKGSKKLKKAFERLLRAFERPKKAFERLKKAFQRLKKVFQRFKKAFERLEKAAEVFGKNATSKSFAFFVGIFYLM